ncbi:lytic transglycosylase domain-containing protein [Roseomonas eburnea]|uniref:Lytic transglycosylase domain-containing protein n=1 Tax=Neoroseomonas eburnea TaxID=1346889 RepID=A0A9X9X965_9PROT|nr:transglycosylase SLT domain-containing protein [Neoroseomonas eburnea]MBR0680251.1 lytic transglycosylase domain-containing protein [Neoroseomonas eburnea]
MHRRFLRHLPGLPILLIAFAAASRIAGASPAAPADPSQLCRAAIAVAERERGIPAGLLQAIGRVESGRRDPATGRVAPWPWTINAEGRGIYFPTREAAIAEVRQLQARGVRLIDIGCMQVNLHHHPTAFPTLEEGFDPLANARYAARFLNELQDVRQDWARSAGNYHSNTPERAEGYRSRVLAAWADEQGRPGMDPAAALAALATARMTGAPGLANGADRARVIPLAASVRAAPGRGLDAYRAAPIMMVGRPMAAAAPARATTTPVPARGSPAFFLFRGPG